MGTTFINLQVKAKLESIPQGIIPKGYILRQTAREWLSVFEADEDYMWEKLCRLGRKISKEQNTSVIAVRFIDGDDFYMSLLKDGKTTASYQAGASRNYCAGSTKWIAGLELAKEEASAFRYLLKKEMTAEESMTAFSRLFGISFFTDEQTFESRKMLWDKDAAGIIKEIEEEKKRTKVKNKTRANLIQEISGLFQGLDERKGILKLVYPDETGKLLYGHIHCLEICNDGIWEVHDFHYPEDIFDEDSVELFINYEGSSVCIYNNRGYSKRYSLHDCEEELTALMEIPKDKRRRKDGVPRVVPIHTHIGHVIDQGRYEYFRWNRSKWNKKDELRKVDLETSGKTFLEKDIIAVYEYENMPAFNKAYRDCGRGIPILTKDGVADIRLQFMKESGNTICDVRFFDKDLKIKRRVKIDLMEDKSRYFGSVVYTYCEETDCVYLGNKKINLKTHEITTGIEELKEASKIFMYFNAENVGFLYAVRGSYVYVFDLEMNLLSCHRLKGEIICFYMTEKGTVHLITAGSKASGYKSPAVRLYEIVH